MTGEPMAAETVITQLGPFNVRVIHRPDMVDGLGNWDETTGEINLRDHPSTIPGAIILIHESMHMAESILLQEGIIEQRVPEEFIENAASMILYAMACVWLLKDPMTPSQIEQFISEQKQSGE
jgi:hypothetical protein